jgi:hypothetical protein
MEAAKEIDEQIPAKQDVAIQAPVGKPDIVVSAPGSRWWLMRPHIKSSERSSRRWNTSARISNDLKISQTQVVRPSMGAWTSWSIALAKVEVAVPLVNDDVAEMEPVTDDARSWELMGDGVLAVVGFRGRR